MGRDLRQTPLYREIEEHFRTALEPGFGSVTPSPTWTFRRTALASPSPEPD